MGSLSSAGVLVAFILAGLMSREEADLVAERLHGKLAPESAGLLIDEIMSTLRDVRRGGGG